MRKFVPIGLAALALALGGCGSKTVINTNPMTDEEKKKVAEEDKKVADEESQGTAGKPPKAKAKKP